MRTNRQVTNAILKVVSRPQIRSPLFWWMVAHHDEIAGGSANRIHWKSLCEAFAKLGLHDTRGLPPTERNARETWRRARIEVVKQKERLAAAEPAPSAEGVVRRSKPPCRMSSDWRPQEVPQRPRPQAQSRAAAADAWPLDKLRDASFFQTVDASGAAVPEGHVFYSNRVLRLSAAQVAERADREAIEMDRGK